MLRRFNHPFLSNFGKNISVINEFARELDRFFQEPQGNVDWFWQNDARGPYVNLFDKGEYFQLIAEVPGLSEKDLKINANAEGITLKGERNLEAPEGYTMQRQERASLNFSRSFQFPERVDVENISAQLKDGILEIKILKAPETRPKQIKIQVQ